MKHKGNIFLKGQEEDCVLGLTGNEYVSLISAPMALRFGYVVITVVLTIWFIAKQCLHRLRDFSVSHPTTHSK